MDSDSSLTDVSSELSSTRSLSPPVDYPSPISSQEPEPGTGQSCQDHRKRANGDSDTSSSSKKRRKVVPKPRTTEYLDLTTHPGSFATEQKEQLDLLRDVLHKRRKIVVIAGAGISVSAGIPDFRSSTGLFKSLKSEHKLKASGKQLFDASVYQTDSSTSSFHDMVRSLSGLVSAAKPTEFHRMLSILGEQGRLMRLYTQNVDGIDVALPSLETHVPLSSKGPWPRTIQLHGGLEKMVCSKCNALSNFAPNLFNGPEPPPCNTCAEADRVRTAHAGKRSHGIGRLRPRIVLYNEHNPDEEAIGSCVNSDLRVRPDAIIVVGTSMKIPGVRRIVREMCGVVRSRRDGLAVWINQEGPPLGKDFEDCWDLVVKGPCDEVARQWAINGNEHTQCTESDVERAKIKGDVQVVVSSQDITDDQENGMPTPAESPLPKQRKLERKAWINLKVKPPAPEERAKRQFPAIVSKPPLSAKTSNPAKRKRKSAMQTAKAPGVAAAGALKSHFNQITKAVKLAGRPRKDKPMAAAEPALPLEQPHAKPIEPVSPTAARNNALIAAPAEAATKPVMFPNLGPGPLRVQIPTERQSRSRRSSTETVSPKSIPRGMEALLH